MLPSQRFYFLRHGETDWNRRGVMQGHTDVALNDFGERQARSVAAAVAALPIATICVSPLQRARQTAALVNINARPIRVIEALKECGFGIHEGEASNGAWRTAWLSGGAIAGGETRRDYIVRVTGALHEALVEPAPVLIVAHGGTFWALEHLVAQQARIPNCTLFEFTPPAAPNSAWGMSQLACPS